MGTIITRRQKDGSLKYRAQIRITKGKRVVHNESQTFSRRAMATAWLATREEALERPGAIDAERHKDKTVGWVLKIYREEVADSGGFGRTKMAHLKQLENMELASLPAVTLTSVDLLAHVQVRRKKDGAGPATVGNDLVWLRIAFRYVRCAKGIPLPLEAIDDAAESARAARLIGKSKRRDRRPSPEELELLDAHFRKQRLRKDGSSPPMRYIMWFAIYSCRRQEELCEILRAEMDRDSSTYRVCDIKHPDGSAGNDKLALMPVRGWEVVDAVLRDIPADESGRLLPFNHRTVSAAFTRACQLLDIKNLRFHDLRHEGCSRLGEDAYTIPQIQQVSLHESWGSLQRYVNMPPVRARRVDFEDIKPRLSSPSSRSPRAHREIEPAH
jgi:integrase